MIVLDVHIIPGLPGQPSILVEVTSRGTFWRFLPVAPLRIVWWPSWLQLEPVAA